MHRPSNILIAHIMTLSRSVVRAASCTKSGTKSRTLLVARALDIMKATMGNSSW